MSESEEKYTPPTISNELGRPIPEAAADRNFYSRGSHVPALTKIDGVPVADLVSQYGSPVFVFSERDIREKARHMREAFDTYYKKYQFAWSYKTNYLAAICNIFHQEGWIAEVVSDFEYEKARHGGVKGEDIVFNGPYKQQAALEQAIDEGSLVQIDNWDELKRIEEIAENRNKPAKVGIRVWLDAGIKPIWSKFGFALENGEAARAAERIVKNKKLHLHTLHTHLGTYILVPSAYKVAAQKLVALREQIEMDHKHLVDCLNLGGGFPSHSMLHGMMGPADQLIPPIEAYAEAIGSVLNKLPEKKKPLLRLETGRHLIDEAGYLLTAVTALKGVNRPALHHSSLSALEHKERLIMGEDARTGYIVDAGINLLYTAAWYRIDAFPNRKIDEQPVPSRLYGSLCMAIDVIRDYINLPPLEVGDILTLHPVGAYNAVQSMQFISYRPAVVLISENGKTDIIRRHETLEDVIGPEVIPARLQEKS